MNDLFEFFGFSEGAEDTANREIAKTKLKEIIEAIKKKELTHWFETPDAEPKGWTEIPSAPKNYIVYDLSKIENLENAQLALGISDGSVSGGLFSLKKGKQRISITMTDKTGKYLSSDGKAVKWLKKLAIPNESVKFLEERSNVFIHEFIHLMDKKRIPTSAWNKAIGDMSAGGVPSYYNDPIETNAFIQMGFANFEKRLNHVKSKAGARLVLGPTPQEFYKRLLLSMDKPFISNLSDKNKKKLQKRSYQFWNDTFEKFK